MIRLAQILLPDAPPRERRVQALDAAALHGRADVVAIPLPRGGSAKALREALAAARAEVAHLYGPPLLPPGVVAGIGIPLVASARTDRSFLPWRTSRQPDVILGSSPETSVPEAVEQGYFEIAARAMPSSFRIGCAVRSRAARVLAEGTRHRIERFRDDIRWMLFEDVPAPGEMSLLNVWVDAEPAEGNGWSGIAEALAAGRAVVAAATPANRRNLEEGAAGFLVPPDDPNETAHAVLAALFKPELRDPRIARGKAMAESYRPEQRATRLLEIYERLRR